MVYVLDIAGNPLMPTERHGKVRRMLNSGQAKVVRRTPFTIQLCYESGHEVQEVALGVDAGSKTIGLSATTDKKELFASEVQLRNDIVDLLSTRRELRRGRRNRKTRYRAPRFLNRRCHAGWIAPSVRQKIDTHLQAVRNVCKILPIAKIVVETASFDIQKLKNPDIAGEQYQQGEQLDFWNVREYVLWRDGHKCQCCKGKSGDKILNVHHIESRKTGGDAPNNLITLCETCHDGHHKGVVKLPASIKRGRKFNHETFMSIMRWAFYNRLKEEHPDKAVSHTFGYITKNTRIQHKLPKTHAADARCISGHPTAAPMSHLFKQKKVRNHNRQIHKANPSKGGKRKANQSTRVVFGFRRFDKVRFQNRECFIFGKRSSGYFHLRLLDGVKVNTSASYKKLVLLEKARHFLVERQPTQPINKECYTPPRL